MKRGSLRLRLFAAGAASLVFALGLAGLGLLLLFERHVERRMEAELESHLRQLVSALVRTPDGSLHLAAIPAEPRFSEPLSGLYWQISGFSDRPLLRSRSLWDSGLELPSDRLADAEVHRHTVAGPAGASLLVVERRIVLPGSLGGGTVRAAVAVDRAEIHAAGRAFASDLAPSLSLLALILLAAAWVQVGIGLKPLDDIRRRLQRVRAGEDGRLGDGFPDEVRPLAAEVDRLLAAQEESLERARAKAADLAHGLRTPLALLQADAEELRKKGETQLANEIGALTASMGRHIERELARARAGAGAVGHALQPVRPVLEEVAEVLRRTPEGADLDWEVDCPADLTLAVDRQDLTEIVGNLAENANKWARGKVILQARRSPGSLSLKVEDDGPGLPHDGIGTALTRGGRLDESRPGSGLGLAIVADLVESYGGSLSLEKSQLGGLLAEVHFSRPK